MRDLELFLGLQGDPCIRDDCTWCPGLPALLRATAACSGNNTQDRPWYAACQRCLTQNGKTGRNHLVAIGCESYRLVQERVLRTRHVCPRPVVCSAVEGSKLVYYKSHRDQERVGDIGLSAISGCRIDTEDSTIFHIYRADPHRICRSTILA